MNVSLLVRVLHTKDALKLMSFNAALWHFASEPSYPVKTKHYILIDCCLNVPLENISIHEYGDVSIAGEGLQNLGLCLALMAFE